MADRDEDEEDNNNCDPGCGDAAEGCDACGSCDGCGGLSLFLSLSTLVMLLAHVAGIAERGRDRIPVVRRWRTRSQATRFALVSIRAYQRWVSPRLSTRCRYTPTCSAFAARAVELYGIATGARLAAERLRRCRTTVPCGTPDPVPAVHVGVRA